MIDYSEREYSCIPRLLSSYLYKFEDLDIKKYRYIGRCQERYNFISVKNGISYRMVPYVDSYFYINPQTRIACLEFRRTGWHPILMHRSIKLFTQFVIDYLQDVLTFIDDDTDIVSQFIKDLILEIETKKIKIIKAKH